MRHALNGSAARIASAVISSPGGPTRVGGGTVVFGASTVSPEAVPGGDDVVLVGADEHDTPHARIAVATSATAADRAEVRGADGRRTGGAGTRLFYRLTCPYL